MIPKEFNSEIDLDKDPWSTGYIAKQSPLHIDSFHKEQGTAKTGRKYIRYVILLSTINKPSRQFEIKVFQEDWENIRSLLLEGKRDINLTKGTKQQNYKLIVTEYKTIE